MKDRALDVGALSKLIGLDKDQVQSFVDYYNSDFSAYDNSVYERIESRVSHWVNYAGHSWFAERIDVGLNALQRLLDQGTTLFLDVGFSIPYPYTRASLAESRDLNCVFVDKEESARSFYAVIRDALGLRWRANLDTPRVADIEREGDHTMLFDLLEEITSRNRVATIFVMASEVVEHLQHDEMYWAFLRKLRSKFPQAIRTYVTLPIGETIPSHNLEFPSSESALTYLRERMDIETAVVLTPPPSPPVSRFLTACFCAYGGVT